MEFIPDPDSAEDLLRVYLGFHLPPPQLDVNVSCLFEPDDLSSDTCPGMSRKELCYTCSLYVGLLLVRASSFVTVSQRLLGTREVTVPEHAQLLCYAPTYEPY